MPAPSTLTAFRDAGWQLKRTGYQSERATASNGQLEVEFSEMTSTMRSVFFRDPASGFSIPIFITVDENLPRIIQLIIEAQPALDWDSYKQLVGGIVATGASVTTLVDGESVPIVAPSNGGDATREEIDPRRFR